MSCSRLVEYIRYGQRHLGVLHRPIGTKKWVVFTRNGDTVDIFANQIVHEFPKGSLSSEAAPPLLTDFVKAEDRVRFLLREARLHPRELWRAFVNVETVDLSMAAKRLWDTDSDSHLHAAYRYCSSYPQYFKCIAGAGIRCRPSLEVASRIQSTRALWKDDVERGVLFRQLGLDTAPPFTPAAVDRKTELDVGNLRGILAAVRDYALVDDMRETGDEAVYTRILKPLGFGARPADAVAFLTMAGVLSADVNPHRLRAVAALTPHSPHAEQDALRLAETIMNDEKVERVPLLDDVAICVDSASTTEVDDGLGVFIDEQGQEWLRVHIADPSRFVPRGTPLDDVAMRRCVTVYLPEGSCSMFPRGVASGPMSLRVYPHQSSALTFQVRLDEKGAIAEYKIFPSLLNKVHRLTYGATSALLRTVSDDVVVPHPLDTAPVIPLRVPESGVARFSVNSPGFPIAQADRVDKKFDFATDDAVVTVPEDEGVEMIPGPVATEQSVLPTDPADKVSSSIAPKIPQAVRDEFCLTPIVEEPVSEHLKQFTPLLRKLLKYAALRSEYRHSLGALSFDIQNVDIHVQDDIIEMHRGEFADAQLLVSEMMILAGETAALYATQHNIPIVYRTQVPPPTEAFEAVATVPENARPYAMLNFMSSATYSATPSGHAGLGLPAYAHATSPIRRYADIVVHRQIKAHLAGLPLPYDRPAVEKLAQHIDETSKAAQTLQRASERFWALMLVSEQQRNRFWPSLVVECVEVNEGEYEEGIDFYYHVTVVMDEVGIRSRFTSKQRFYAGTRISVTVLDVDPFAGIILVSPTSASISHAAVRERGEA